MSVPVSNMLRAVDPETVMKAFREIRELAACMQGKGEVVSEAKKLLKEINCNFNSIIEIMAGWKEGGQKEKLQRQQCLNQLNEYSDRFKLELYPIISDDKLKNRLKRAFFRSNYLEELQNFSQDLVNLKSTIAFRIMAVSLSPRHEEIKEEQDRNEAHVNQNQPLPFNHRHLNEAENRINLPSQAEIKKAYAENRRDAAQNAEVKEEHERREEHVSSNQPDNRVRPLLFSAGPIEENMRGPQQAKISEVPAPVSIRPK